MGDAPLICEKLKCCSYFITYREKSSRPILIDR